MKIKQILCTHQNVDIVSWQWDLAETGISQNKLRVAYICNDCGKRVIKTLKGKDAVQFATIMNTREQKGDGNDK